MAEDRHFLYLIAKGPSPCFTDASRWPRYLNVRVRPLSLSRIMPMSLLRSLLQNSRAPIAHPSPADNEAFDMLLLSS